MIKKDEVEYMQFKDSGLPRSPMVYRAFMWLQSYFNREYPGMPNLIRQPVSRAKILAEAHRPPDPALVTAGLLIYMSPGDGFYAWARKDFGARVHGILESQAKFDGVCGDDEETCRRLRNPGVAASVKTIYMTSALAGLRGIDKSAEPDPVKLKGLIALGEACKGEDTGLTKLFDACVANLNKEDSGRHERASGWYASGTPPVCDV